MSLLDMPVGSVISWKPVAIPTGWAACDGNNGTPNLVGRQPRGASIDDDLRVTGGAATHLHGNPDTADRPAHDHGGSHSASVGAGSSTSGTVGTLSATAAPPNHGHSGSFGIGDSDIHDHTVGDTLSANFTPRHIKRVFIRRMS